MVLDKRKCKRLDCRVTVRHEGKRGVTRDLSQGGTFIRTDLDNNQIPLFPVGTGLSFSLEFPASKEDMAVNGVVVHHGKNGDGMGVYFRRIDESSKEFIRKFISDYL